MTPTDYLKSRIGGILGAAFIWLFAAGMLL
jgi:hypothetical protein